jgi:cbb3-type cytochrome oxidase subunit 1
MRLAGGVMYLAGVVMMAWNFVLTARGGVTAGRRVGATEPAVAAGESNG